MIKYIAFIRGINVGGKNKLKMAELREHLSSIGFINLQSYIQSGNLIFEYPTKLTHIEIETILENEIKSKFEIDTRVIVRTHKQLVEYVNMIPYSSEFPPEQFFLCILKNNVREIKNNPFDKPGKEDDEFRIFDDVVYLRIPFKSYLSKLSNNFFEKILKSPATTRNWRTINKLITMSE